jgi:UTP--glucose-1-phosphate uridylyltransferase
MLARPIRKAVFPVGGQGTRFLPATKAIPKEMLPLLDRPLIQVVVDEALSAGIEQLIFVTGRNKAAIEDHFDRNFELEATFLQRGEMAALEKLGRDTLPQGATSFTRQQQPLGLGHAIWCARHLVGDEPFAVLLPDMIMMAEPGCMTQLVDTYHNAGGGNVLAVEETDWGSVERYGVVKTENWRDNIFSIVEMVEKPSQSRAPSNLIISGRYILQPEIFAELERQEPGKGGEIQITDAMNRLVGTQQFTGVRYAGKTYDCGNQIGLLCASVAHALRRADLGSEFKERLSEIAAQSGGKLTWDEE